MKRLAFSYTRWSTPEQRHGDSKRRQQEAFARFCEYHQLTPDKSYSDEGASGRGEHIRGKGRLKAFMDAVDNGEIPPNSVLVVENLDRLSRLKLSQATALINEILSAGVDIGLVSTGQIYKKSDLDDFGTDTVIRGELYRAWADSQRKSELIGKSWEQKKLKARESHQLITRRVPAWFKHGDDGKPIGIVRVAKGEYSGKPVADKVKVKLIHRALNKILAGDGIATICGEFNAAGVPTIGRAKRWIASDLWELATNRRLIGEYQQTTLGKNTALIKGFYPAVVSESLFNKVQRALRARRPTENGRRNPRRVVNLFTGLIFSQFIRDKNNPNSQWRGYDPVHINTKERHSSLVPRSALDGTGGYCSFPYDAVETALRFAWVKYLPIEQLSPRRNREHIALVQSMKAEIEAIDEKLGKLNVIQTEVPTKETQRIIKALEVEQEELQQRVDAGKLTRDDSPRERATAIREMFDTMDRLKNDHLRKHRERLRSLIAESVRAIELRISSFSRFKKSAYLTVMLRESDDDAFTYKKSDPIFILLRIVCDRRTIAIWNKRESDKGKGGYLIDRSNIQNAINIPPHISSSEEIIRLTEEAELLELHQT